MKAGMTLQRLVILLLVALGGPTHGLAQSDMFKNLQTFYADVMPTESFVPTVYGADDRYSPKTIWIYVDNLYRSGRGFLSSAPQSRPGWIAASSGRSIYPDEYVTVQRRPINLPIHTQNADTKWGFAASASGMGALNQLEAGINLARENGIDVEISIGEAEIEYVYYFDLLAAQDDAVLQIAKFDDLARRSNGGDAVPPSRTIVSAIRVRDTEVTAQTDDSFSGSINADLSNFLSQIGLSFDSSSESFDRLTIDEWRYVAYEAIYSQGDTVRISSSELDEDIVPDATWDSSPEENFFYCWSDDPDGNACIREPLITQ